MTHPGTLIEQGVKEYGYELMIQATLELLCGEVPAIPLQAFGGTSGWQPIGFPPGVPEPASTFGTKTARNRFLRAWVPNFGEPAKCAQKSVAIGKLA